MAKFNICGQKPLSGEIRVFGAKNAAMKMIAASCLIKEKVTLDNVPDILDIQKLVTILEGMGAKTTRKGHRLEIDTTDLRKTNPDPDLVRSMRASVVLVGPLLARFGKVKIPHPGGCVIGARPIDRHIKAFEDLGVQVKSSEDLYGFEITGKISGKVNFDRISVTGTENILLFGASLPQTITITGAAIEPEVIDLIDFLKKAGAKIIVQGRTIKIQGQPDLRSVEHKVIPDRIEAGTFAILAATNKASLQINDFNHHHLQSLLEKFSEMQIEFEKGNNFLYIKRPSKISPTHISTAEYPGFPTDLQSPMGVLLTQAEGTSRISENIFENRLEYLRQLEKMGAKVRILSQNEAEITGPSELRGAQIHSLDLRAGATLLIAGLAAYGETEIFGAETIDRGYEKIEERLSQIGAAIQRVQ